MEINQIVSVNTNHLLIDFLQNNCFALILLYSLIRSMFPHNKLIQDIGAYFRTAFPSIFGGRKAPPAKADPSGD